MKSDELHVFEDNFHDVFSVFAFLRPRMNCKEVLKLN